MENLVERGELEVAIRAIEILGVTTDKEPQLLAKYRRQLEHLLSSNDNGSLPIHVISIYGNAFGGKSFLMNLLINYLKNNCEKLEGLVSDSFKVTVRKRAALNTVYVYPEIFVRESINGQFGIMLMDIQGLFDGTCASVIPLQFKVCKILSSVMLLNIGTDNVSSYKFHDVLEYLKDDDNVSNHQNGYNNLVLLLRDQPAKRLTALEAVIQNFTSIDEFTVGRLRQKFKCISCFSLTRPSNAVTRNKFKGDIRDLPPYFLNAVEYLFRNITVNGNYDQLLLGNQLLAILQKMTAMSIVQWDKFTREYLKARSGQYKNYTPLSRNPNIYIQHQPNIIEKDVIIEKQSRKSETEDESIESNSNTPDGNRVICLTLLILVVLVILSCAFIKAIRSE